MTTLPTPVFELTGGALALDFANSLEKHPVRDLLSGYSDLVEWAGQSGLVDASKAERLRGTARRRARDAQRVFHRATRLRQAIYGTFSALAAGREVDSQDLDAIRQEALIAYEHARLVCHANAFRWEFSDDLEALDSPLWAIAKNAVDLLGDSGSLAAVRECASATCAWLFLDRSRNRTRRWCDMKICGNRAKSQRHYRRSQQANAG